MERIMVVYDGTDASSALYDMLSLRVAQEGLAARVRRFDIERDSESGLCEGAGISEFRGSISHLAANVGDVTMLLVHLAPVSREVIDAAPALVFVGSERSSLPNVDAAYARARGVRVCYAAGRNVRTVAEFTVGLMLDVTRNISAASGMVKSGAWNRQLNRKPYTGIEMGDRRIGLVGFGGIGRQVAALLAGFGVRVCFYDPLVTASGPEAERVTLEELLSTCDIISVHARGEEGRYLLSDEEFAMVKPGSYFINTARGYLVNEKALIRQLEAGRIRGAALDVFEKEPLPADSPLLTMPQVVLCPHIGGLSEDMSPRSARFVAEDVVHYLRGEALAHEYVPD